MEFTEIMSKNIPGESRELPQGFAFGNNKLCISCYDSLPIISHTVLLELKEKLPNHLEENQSEYVECYWCKKQKEEEQFALRTKWNLDDPYDTCNDCNKIINGLTSIKLRELISLERNNSKKTRLMDKLHQGEAGLKKYSNVFGKIKDEDTEKVKWGLSLMDAKQESINISNLRKNEKNTLAKEYFFNTDSNESETNVHSANTMKINESDDPVEILKIRLAKGEITLDEFNKIKENLEKF